MATTIIEAGHIYDWLISPKSQGGLGLSVLGAMMWLHDWDGVTVPDAAMGWQQKAPGAGQGRL